MGILADSSWLAEMMAKADVAHQASRIRVPRPAKRESPPPRRLARRGPGHRFGQVLQVVEVIARPKHHLPMLSTTSTLTLLFWATLMGGGAWGVRTLPDGDAHWRVRWEGDGAIFVDGERVEGVNGRTGLRVTSDVEHRVHVGGVRLNLPPRPSDPCAPLRLAVLGDGRAAISGVGPSAYWPGMLAEALALEPSFVVNTGDLVKSGREWREWAAYLKSLPPWPPIVAVRGNHDRGPHFDALGLAPGSVFRWQVGPVLLVGFNSEVRTPGRWVPQLARALSSSADDERNFWKIVVLHRPIWSRGNHGSNERGLNELLIPLFEAHGVDLVLSGHDHNYERFCPSLGLGRNRRCVDAGAGPVYVVTAGAATFTNPIPGLSRRVDAQTARADRQASRFYSGAHHLLVIEVTGRTLTLVARRTRTGNVRGPAEIDRFVVTRANAPCAP